MRFFHLDRLPLAKQVGSNSNGSQQLVAFLFALMDLAAACDNLVFVYSLASTADTFAEETNDLQELLRASARQERVLSPSTDVEIYNIAICGFMGYSYLQKPHSGRGREFKVSPICLRTAVLSNNDYLRVWMRLRLSR